MTWIGMDISERDEVILLSDTYAYSYTDEPGTIIAKDRIKVHQIAPGVIFGHAGFVNIAGYLIFQELLEGKSAFIDMDEVISALEEKLSSYVISRKQPYTFYAFGMCNGN